MATEVEASFDMRVIGAGFSGLYAPYRLRQLGLRTRVRKKVENVGGTRLYNSYPGVDVPGERRMYVGYTGGILQYRRRCDHIAAGGYTGFKLA